MAEGPTRRACNRCHAQKLSCRRNGDEPCERCLRLKTECKSSLSLRFRRNRLSLEKSPQREDKQPSKARRTTAAVVPPGCAGSGFTVDNERRGGGFSQSKGHSHAASSNAAFVTFHGSEGLLDTVDFPYSSLQDPLFSQDPTSATFLHTIPRAVSGQDLSSLDSTWSPSYQGPCVDWSQPSSQSSYESSPSSYHYTSSSAFSCLDPQQLRFDNHPDILDAGIEHVQPTRPRVPRKIQLRRSSINRMAAQGKWLAQLSDINSTLFNLSSLVPYLVESGEEVDVYASQSSSQSSNSTGHQDPEPEGFPIQSMFEASGRLVQVLGDITQTEGTDVRQADLDPGTGLLVLSTYVRLLDLYQKVFQLVQSEVSVSSPSSSFRLCKLPNVSVGSFPVASALSLQMSLTLRLAEDFLSNLRAATVKFSQRLPDLATRSQQGGGQASLWSVVDVSFTAIREREQDVSRDLVGIRSKLLS